MPRRATAAATPHSQIPTRSTHSTRLRTVADQPRLDLEVMTITPELGHASAGYHHVPLKVDAAPGETNSNALQGVHTRNLTPSVAEDLGVSTATHGVVVTSVDPSSAAAAAGLDAGDVIQEVDRKPVHNVDEYRQALAEAHGRSVLLLVNRGGSTHFLVIQPQ